MALRNIRKFSDEILRKKSREVTVFDGRLYELLDDMAETLNEANGAGISAVQVGVLRRAALVCDGDRVIELINPVIIDSSEETVSAAEGCLSFPGRWGEVTRPKRVTVRAQDRNGDIFEHTGEDITARALCHELDHLDGVIFMDLATEMLEDEDPGDGE
ncbi:MAG: peptide deformylase [Oscillospiraceae bacterium]|jgi:peptide deformylase|nr:peptide deformylase [Oscillospiraceae bacterium]